MDDLYPVFATAAVIVVYFLFKAVSGGFDPFAPTWLFFVGYMHVYVIQALTYHEWAVGVRGKELVWAANMRALWALVWFLFVYHLPIGRLLAAALPAAPRNWSPRLVATISPPLVLWGLFCAGMLVRAASSETTTQRGIARRCLPVRDDGGGGALDRHRPDDPFAPTCVRAGGPAWCHWPT